MTGQCVDPLNCPQNFYGDPDTTFCESNCTDASLYGDNTTKKCQSTCTTGFKQNFTKLCVETCPVANHEDDGEYGDSDSGFCILTCPANFYADNQTNRECVATCADSPAETYG